jgi:hypothetical protein
MRAIPRRSLIERSTALAAAGTLAQARTEHPFDIAIHDVTACAVTPKDGIAQAFKRIDEIFAKYEIKA